MKQKATTMVLKVDLQCSKCYRKIKRVLCQLPQIHDQVFDEKANTVTIKVVCCSPDCIKNKIISKAGDTLKGINIKLDHVELLPKPTNQKPANWIDGRGPPPPPPEVPQKPKSSAPSTTEKPLKPIDPLPQKPKGPSPPPPQETQNPRGPPPPPPEEPQKPKSVPPPASAQVSMAYVQGFPASGGYHDYSEGVQYAGYYGRPVYDSYGGGRSCHQVSNRCDDYFSEENTGACAIM